MFTFPTRAERAEPLGLLRRAIQSLLLPRLTQVQRTAVLEHLTWLDAQKTPLSVTAKFETIPELRLTRLTLDYTYSPPPSH